MEHVEYFDNLDEIEKSWREMKTKNFPQDLRDGFWGLCMKGQTLFWQLSAWDRKGIGKVPAFERAVMLLEWEGRYQDAIRMCEVANKWQIETDWYTKRIEKLKKKL